MGKTIKMNSFQDVCKDVEQRFVKAGIKTVNIVAASARNNAKREIEKNFTLRNKFTLSGVRFTPCGENVKTLSEIKSFAGIDERRGYMERQEIGGRKENPSGKNLIIPNTRARGGSNTHQVLSPYRYNKVIANTVHWPKRNGSRKARLVATAFVAAKEGKFIRIKDSFFKVSNFQKSGDKISFKAKQFLNLKHDSTYTPKTEWLSPAADYAAKMMQTVFNKQMDMLN